MGKETVIHVSQCGNFYILQSQEKRGATFTVFENGLTHATAKGSHSGKDAKASLKNALAQCNRLAERRCKPDEIQLFAMTQDGENWTRIADRGEPVCEYDVLARGTNASGQIIVEVEQTFKTLAQAEKGAQALCQRFGISTFEAIGGEF